MKREIKFRFYGQSDDGQWSISERTLDDIEDSDSWQGPRKFKRKAVCQFTGLKDKDGKEIYEGDIIMPVSKRYPFYDDGRPNYVGTIEWCFAGFHCVLNLVNKDKTGISDGVNEPFEDGEWCEVIGNIYENPDLLK